MAKFMVLFLFLNFVLYGCSGTEIKLFQEQDETVPLADSALVWDFGEIKQGQVVRHEFILENKTGKVMNIKSVNTSCGCTVSQVKKNILSPGESTSIEASFNSKGYNGQVQQYIYVNTDNLEEPILKFTIKATVIK